MNKKIISALLTISMLTGMSMATSVNAEKLPANGPSKDVTDNVFNSLPQDLEKEKGTWYFKEAKTAFDAGYITGKGEPDGKTYWRALDLTTRAEMTRILRRKADVSEDDIKGKGAGVSFNDSKKHWAADDIAWAAEMGIVEGRSSTEFAPDDPITRAEIATMLVRASEKPELKIDLTVNSPRVDGFADTEKHWAAEYIEKARLGGLINGKLFNSDGKALFVPDDNTNRAEIAAMMTRCTDPMYYALSNMQSILPTKDTRPCIQFKAKSTVTIEAFNSIILPQFGLDSEKYTVVIPDYQLKIYEDDEEHKYMDPAVDEETGEIKHDPETGDILYDIESCGCNSLLGTCQYGGAGDEESRLPKIYLAIKNTKTGEMTKYSYYEYKMKKVLGDDEGYVALKAVEPGKIFKFDFKTFDEAYLTNCICQALEIETTADMPVGFTYKATLADGEFKKLQETFDALENNGMSQPMTIHITLQNLSSMSEPAKGSFKVVIAKNNLPFNPSVDWEYEG